MWFLIVLLVIILIIAFKSIKVVRQSEVYIIERLGKFHKVADAGSVKWHGHIWRAAYTARKH